jgi:hypothetical protein
MLERFIEAPDFISKGPYLSIKLPFEKGEGQSDFFLMRLLVLLLIYVRKKPFSELVWIINRH